MEVRREAITTAPWDALTGETQGLAVIALNLRIHEDTHADPFALCI